METDIARHGMLIKRARFEHVDFKGRNYGLTMPPINIMDICKKCLVSREYAVPKGDKASQTLTTPGRMLPKELCLPSVHCS